MLFGVTFVTVAETKDEEIAHLTYFKAVQSDFANAIKDKNNPGILSILIV